MSKILFLSVLIFLSHSIKAQQNWLRSYGGQTSDEVLDAATDQNGNILMTGYFSGANYFGTTLLQSFGSSDILLIKTNPAGDITWAINAGGAGADRANSITSDNSGNSYITGYFNNTATFGSITITGQGRDAFVAKIDPSGTFLWVKSMGGQFGDTGYGVEVDNSGNVFCTGQYKGLGTFGTSTFNSTINPTDGLPSYDIFLSKLNSNGVFLWTRDGKAKYDDRGISIATDAIGNCYLTGQFSDSITFQNTYNNVAFNAGLIMKFDANGNDQWVTLARASQVLVNDIKWKGNNVYLVGDYIGNLSVDDINGNTSYTSLHNYNVMTLKISDQGVLNWLASNYSESELYSKQLVLDSNNDIYLTGMFKCKYDEMNQIYGNSTFRSVGYRDVHYMKYSNSGQFQWARQVGSQKDDYCASIVLNDIDFPIIAGSFESFMNVPAGSNFTFQNSQNMPTPFANCVGGNVGGFASQGSNGNKDVFLTSPFDPNRLPYDYYAHEIDYCSTDTIGPCIEDCIDSVEFCFSAGGYLIGTNHFQIQSILSPLYTYQWNTGSTANTLSFAQAVNVTQTYYIEVERLDGCFFWEDSIVVSINPLPNPPLITDSWGYNTNQPPSTFNIDTCSQDTLFITATVDAEDSLAWSSNYDLINDSTAYILTTGLISAAAVNSYGCSSFNSIHVTIDDFATHDTLIPQIIFDDLSLETTDSIISCNSFSVVASILDESYTNIDGSTPFKHTLWYLDGVLFDSIYHTYSNNPFGTNNGISIQDTGWYNLTAHLVNECGDSSDYFIDRDIYIGIVPSPQLTVSQNSSVCVGDTITLYAYHYQDSVLAWNGPNIIANYGDSIDVVAVGLQSSYTVEIDTTALGLTCESSAGISISTPTQPEIEMYPLNGIVCPNDSVLLTAINGSNWEWIGPSGIAIGTSQSVYVTVPGFYHCTVTAGSGCILTSNFVEVKEYSSPFFLVDNNALCPGDTATIEIFSPIGTGIDWFAPLTGNSNVQQIITEGVYYCETSFCNITAIDSVVITASNPVANLYSNETILCPQDTIVLEPLSNTTNITWSNQSTDSILTVTTAGEYSFSVELNGCYAYSDTITIVEHDYLTFNENLNQTICFGQSTILSLDASYQTVWLDQNLDTISTLNSINTGVLFDTTSYTIYISQIGFCPITALSNIDVVQSGFTPLYTINDSICANDIISIETSEGYSGYTWTQNGAFSSANYFTNIPTFSEGTVNIALFVDVDGCHSDTALIDVTVYPNPEVSLPPDSMFCFDQNLLINSNNYHTNYEWTENPDPQYDSLVVYSVITDMGCTLTDSMNISYQECDLNTPNVFTPNGDLVNDVFHFEIHNGEILRVRIFNRWGNLIYESNTGEWYGNHKNGSEVSAGVYFYIVDYETFNAVFNQEQGYVTLIR